MRLEPIEKPRGLRMKMAYWMSRRTLGKVITPLRVVYARAPKSAKVGYAVNRYLENDVSLEPALRLLVQVYVASINDCVFCVDIGRAIALKLHTDLDKFSALAEFETDARFTGRERAALAYVGEACRTRRVSDNTFARVQEHFSEQEIVELTLVNAIEHFYNLINVPLGIESDGLCAIASGSGNPQSTHAAARS